MASAGFSSPTFRKRSSGTRKRSTPLPSGSLPGDTSLRKIGGAFPIFFHPQKLLALRQTESPRELRFLHISGRERRTVCHGGSLFRSVRAVRLPLRRSAPRTGAGKHLPHVFPAVSATPEKLFDAIIELDMDTGRAPRFGRRRMATLGKTSTTGRIFSRFAGRKGVHEEYRAMLADLLSLETLRAFAGGSDGYRSVEARSRGTACISGGNFRGSAAAWRGKQGC